MAQAQYNSVDLMNETVLASFHDVTLVSHFNGEHQVSSYLHGTFYITNSVVAFRPQDADCPINSLIFSYDVMLNESCSSDGSVTVLVFQVKHHQQESTSSTVSQFAVLLPCNDQVSHSLTEIAARMESTRRRRAAQTEVAQMLSKSIAFVDPNGLQNIYIPMAHAAVH
eukprot:CAMPEP_0184674196 /NCGR_PEP_ID=MMETSP0308-20130426/87103_1 /TAXON_ID=38269 /ORGANISM="Gloeochaete witrockiana, Strain SAG 46.84" /LENGTH=167 /DNA_ID=CAMNT_0027121775 /DNA_START=193 /DNA_END=696 /DNA_ORIENTATION=+